MQQHCFQFACRLRTATNQELCDQFLGKPAMHLLHSSAVYEPPSAFNLLRCAMISSVTKSLKAAILDLTRPEDAGETGQQEVIPGTEPHAVQLPASEGNASSDTIGAGGDAPNA